MSVPLDNLYHWVESLLPDPAVLYVFRPHGSKKFLDCNWLNDYDRKDVYRFPGIIIHDQEPLDWQYYNNPEEQYFNQLGLPPPLDYAKIQQEYAVRFNLQSLVLVKNSLLYDNTILIHSEKNSCDLTQYKQNGFIDVHYWAHAVIARDWYRFAQFDTRLNQPKSQGHKFLIYCRDWSHRREYRLKFLELLAKNELENDSLISVMHINSDGVHFSQHKFLNAEFELTDPEIITQFKNNDFGSTSSASYDYADFTNTEISVVLETVFDDSRIHLTEKTLRPIACGHPFILVAGPNALEYIKSYGFKTFAPWIDESYDTEPNSLKRMEKIQQAMIQIKNLKGQEYENFLKAVKSIAEFNKQHFFSDKFFNILQTELKDNLNQAYTSVKNTKGKHYMELIKLLKNQNLIHLMPQRQKKTQLVRQLRQSCSHDQSNPQEDSPA